MKLLQLIRFLAPALCQAARRRRRNLQLTMGGRSSHCLSGSLKTAVFSKSYGVIYCRPKEEF